MGDGEINYILMNFRGCLNGQNGKFGGGAGVERTRDGEGRPGHDLIFYIMLGCLNSILKVADIYL